MTKAEAVFDKENLLEVIKNSPNQLLIGFKLADDLKLDRKLNGMILSGMGGSALPGELIKLFLRQEKSSQSFEVKINRNYNLASQFPSTDKLYVFSSYSGNTEETLAALKDGLKLKVPILIMTSGGKLEKIALKKNLPLIKIPGGIQPRMALGYTFGALLGLLAHLKIINVKIENLRKTAEKISRDFVSFNKRGKAIATRINAKTPLIYSSESWKEIALIWKIMINENGKTPAFWNFFPELNHNEMVGFTRPNAKFEIIMLRDPKDHPGNLKRMNLTEKLLKKSKIKSISIDIPIGETILRIFSIIQLGCLASYYLAINNKQDPTPVKMVENFKKQMI